MNMRRGSSKSNQVRIIGGHFRSRVVYFPDVEDLRPSHDRIRETLFNWLHNHVPGARCLDLFAGSGVLGMEALSRGAAFVQFVDNSLSVTDSIRENLDLLKVVDSRVAHSGAEAWIRSEGGNDKFDIVFIDPPYRDNKVLAVCDALTQSGCLNNHARIFIENGQALVVNDMPSSLRELKMKKTGRVFYYLYEHIP